MTWGLIVRAESDRGLGVLTRLMHEHLVPDKTLVIRIDHEYHQEIEAFPGATVVDWAGGDLPEAEVRAWLDGLDVVVSAETYYDWNVIHWARDMHVRSVLYVMPELLKHELGHELPMPDQFWYPSSWRLSECPAGDLLTVPCEERPFVEYPTGEIRIVHVAGKPALADRNGTGIVALASKQASGRSRLTVYGQGDLPRFHSNTTVLPGPANKWDMYTNAHVLVLPRRYGGLCLPVIEALSCGLAVAMPDVSPNTDWPIKKLGCEPGVVVQMPCGPVQTYDTDLIDMRTALNPSTGVDFFMSKSREWATANTWAKRKHLFTEALR